MTERIYRMTKRILILAGMLAICLLFSLAFPRASARAKLVFHVQQDASSVSPASSTSPAEIEKTVEKYQKALAARPDNFRLNLEFAHFLLKAERYPDAIDFFQRTLALQPQNEIATLGLAETYAHVRNLDEALAVLRSARTHHPKRVAVLKALGHLETETQSYRAAIDTPQAAVHLAPRDAAAGNLLVTAYLSNGDTAEALLQFDKVLALDPENQTAHFVRAQIYADTDQNEKAFADIEKVVAAQPNNMAARPGARNNLLRTKKYGSRPRVGGENSAATKTMRSRRRSAARR